MSLNRFNEWRRAKKFIETATYKCNQYGFLKLDIERIVKAEKDILLILTSEGYQAFEKLFPNQITAIQIHAPSEEIRLKQIRNRGLIPTDEKQGTDIGMKGLQGWAVCNYDLKTVVRQVKKIIAEVRSHEQ